MNKGIGRPRTFDVDAVLESALAVFWRHGFLEASLTELTAAMGLSKPSLYAAFGDKGALYLKALDRYISQRLAPHLKVLEVEPDCRKAVEGFLKSTAVMFSDPQLPGGCFIVTGATNIGAANVPKDVDAALRMALTGSESRILSRLRRAQQEGQLATDIDVGELAGMFSALLAGLAVQARAGASLPRLHRMIDNLMRAWPTSGRL